MPSAVFQRWPCQNKSNCQPCHHFHSAMAPSPMAQSRDGMGRRTIPCGTARGGIGAQVAQQGSQETQRGPLPHKTLGTEKHLPCTLFCAVTRSWETGVNPRTLLQSISSASSPPPPTASQPRELLLRWEAKPKSQKLHRGTP